MHDTEILLFAIIVLLFVENMYKTREIVRLNRILNKYRNMIRR